MSEKETLECNGVRVSVPVPKGDFTKFYREASFILSFFKTRPEVKSVDFKFDFEESMINRLYDEGSIIMRRSHILSELYSGHQYFVAMGGVCYPVEHYTIRDCLLVAESHESAIEKAKRFIETRISGGAFSLFVNFAIGDLKLNEISASRESLSLNEQTRVKIGTRFVEAISKLLEEDQNLINSQKSFPMALKVMRDRGELSQAILMMYDYKGKALSEARHIKILKNHKSKLFVNNSYYVTRFDIYPPSLYDLTIVDNLKIVYTERGDVKNNGHLKFCKELVSKNNPVVFVEQTDEESLKKYLSYLAIDSYTLYSFTQHKIEQKEATKLARKNRIKTINTTSKKSTKYDDNLVFAVGYDAKKDRRKNVQMFDVNDKSIDYYYANETEFLFDSGLFKYQTVYPYGSIRISDIIKLVNYNNDDRTIVVLRHTDKNQTKIEKNNVKHITELFDIFVELIYAHVKESEVIHYFKFDVWHEELERIKKFAFLTDEFYKKFIEELSNEVEVGVDLRNISPNQLITSYASIPGEAELSQAMRFLFNYGKYAESMKQKKENYTNIDKKVKEEFFSYISEKYPLLDVYLFSNHYRVSDDHIKQYISLIDNKLCDDV